jgi:hypothetical protein
VATLPQNKANFGFAFQTAKGTPQVSAKHRAWLSGGTRIAAAITKNDLLETSGYASPIDSYIQLSEGKGGPECFAMPDIVAACLQAVLGTRNTTGASDPYTHTLTEAPDVPYVTVFMSTSGALFEVFQDVKMVGLKIHGESGMPLRITPTFAGGIASYATTEDTVIPPEKTNRFLYYDGKAALKLESVAVPLMKSFDLNIQRTPIVVPGDQIIPADIALGPLVIDFSYTVTPADFAEYNRIAYGSATPANSAPPTSNADTLAATGVDLLFTRIAASRTLELQLPNVQRDPFADEPNPTPAPLVRTENLSAYKPAAGSSIMTAIVLNGTSGANM